TCRPHMYSIWLRGAIADHVIAHLAARRFDSLINFARRHRKALSNDLKVIDERFHLRLHLFAIRQHYFRSIVLDWSFGHAIERLLHDSNGFAQLLDAANIPCKSITIRRSWHLKLELLIT